jgi:hypothetical protein
MQKIKNETQELKVAFALSVKGLILGQTVAIGNF